MELDHTPETASPEKPNNIWNTVTPLSKYLALTLFVTLPFLGGWIGFTYAPDKVSEKIVLIEKHVWETYRNEDLGFEFQYPVSRWKLTQSESKSGYKILSFTNYTDGKETQEFAIGFSSQAFDTILRPEFLSQNNGEVLLDEVILKDGSGKSLHQIVHKFSSPEYGDRYVGYLDIKFYGEIVALARYVYKIGESSEDIFNQLISSFGFFESEITSDWKTYRDEEYGFTFEYPKDYELTDNVLTRTYDKDGSSYESKITIDVEQGVYSMKADNWHRPIMEKTGLITQEYGYKYDAVQSGTYSLGDLEYFQGTVVNYEESKLELFVLAKDDYFLILRLEFITEEQLSEFKKIIRTITFQE